MRCFIRIPNVGIAFGRLANILAYLGLTTVSNADLMKCCLALEHSLVADVICVCTVTPHWTRHIGFPQVMF